MKPLALLTAALLSGITPNLHAAELVAGDGATIDLFGSSVAIAGTTAIGGAPGDDIGANNLQGSAYIFRNLNTATGTVIQNVKLIADDGEGGDSFGFSVGIFGTTGIAGAYADKIGANSAQGSAYIFRDLDTATGTVTQNVKLIASDGATHDKLGASVGIAGTIAIVGSYEDDIGANSNRGSAYIFRNLDTAVGTVTQNVKLTASDGVANDYFGRSVGIAGTIAIAGADGDAIGANAEQGSAYIFRNLDSATGTITQNVKLTASDGAGNDYFGWSVGIAGTTAIAGAYGDTIGANFDQGSAYIFRNLDSATGTITQNVKLTASDGSGGDNLGDSVGISGTTAITGAYRDDVGANSNQGSAYIFRNLDSASGTVTQNVKLTASDGTANDYFGGSVAIDGDNFVVGTSRKNSYTGKAYSGSVSSMTTLDAGSTSKTISGISFVSQDDWIIGQTTDSNSVTLSAGDTANVTAPGKAVYIGKDAGSDNNTLLINGSLIANQIYVGATGNSGNELIIGETGMVNGNIIFAGGTTVGGDGTITGDLTLGADSKFIFSLTNTLTVTGSVSLDSTFGIDDVIGLDSSAALGTYTLINGTATDFSTLGLENWGAGNAYELGDGKSAYFSQGSLMVNVVPEPGTLSLLALGLSAFALRRRRS